MVAEILVLFAAGCAICFWQGLAIGKNKPLHLMIDARGASEDDMKKVRQSLRKVLAEYGFRGEM